MLGKFSYWEFVAFYYLNLWFLYLYFFFYVNAAWPHNSFTRTPGCLLLHQNFTFINNILSSSTNLYAAFCLFHFHLLFDYITANASKTSKPFSKINSRTATSTPEPPPTWAVLAAATPPDNHAAPLVSCWCFLRRRAPADAAWIFFSTLLREEGPPPPAPSRPAGWPSLVLLSLVRCLYETPSSLKWFWTWIFYFFDTCLFYWLQHDFCKDHGSQSFHLLCSCRVGRNYCQVLLHFLPWRSHENLTWKKTELPAVTWLVSLWEGVLTVSPACGEFVEFS